MFMALLLATLAVAVIVSFIVVRIFDQPVAAIMDRIVASDIAFAWTKYLRFAIYVVGISGGVRIFELETYVRPATENFEPPPLSIERWILEIFRTIIESLQSIAWMLLVFFVFALIAYVIVRAFELKRDHQQSKSTPEA